MGSQELHACEYCPKSFATTKELKCAKTFFSVAALTDLFTTVDIIRFILARISVINARKDSHLEVDLIVTE